MTSLQGNGFDRWLAAQDAATRSLCLLDQVGLYAAYLTRLDRKKSVALVEGQTKGTAG